MAVDTNTSPAQNGTHNESHNTNQRRDILLVSVPRTASNLLLKVLNIHRQPNVVTNKTGGYFFYDAYMIAARDLQKPAAQWTDAEKTLVRDTYQKCLDRFEELRAQAHADGKVLFAKEHAFWLVNPGVMHTQFAPPSSSSSENGSSNGASRDGAANGHGDDMTSFFRLQIPDIAERTCSPNNPTLFPDSYLRSWQLAFIIRHPALAWPSMYRAMRKIQTELGMLDDDGVRGASVGNMSFAWTRRMFDWASAANTGGTAPPPLVIDAHDIIHNPEAALRFCEKAGLDRSVVQFEWGEANESVVKNWGKDEGSKDERAARIMLSTLEASKGVVKDKAPATVDIKAEAEKWRAEFGDEVAAMIEKRVWDAMPDYEYLRERRVQA